MKEIICDKCHDKKSASAAKMCNKCGKTLCDSCRDYKDYCKDSKNGTAGCDGRFEKLLGS